MTLPFEEWGKGHMVLPTSVLLCQHPMLINKHLFRWGHLCPLDTFLDFTCFIFIHWFDSVYSNLQESVI